MDRLLGSVEEFISEQNAAENSVRAVLSELMEMERQREARPAPSRRKSGRVRRPSGPQAPAPLKRDSESVQRVLKDMLVMEDRRREAESEDATRRAEESRRRWLKEERKRAEDREIVRSIFSDLLPPEDAAARRENQPAHRSGAASLKKVHPVIASKITGIGGWERAFADSDFDNLILVQCVNVEALLSFLLLSEGGDIAGEISRHLSERQKEIIRFFFSRQQRATLGLIQLWLVGLRRHLVDSVPAERSERLQNWISARFGSLAVQGRRENAGAIFSDKRLVAFIDRFRSDYRNPLVHPENRDGNAFDADSYTRWCQVAWGTPRLNDWLNRGWSGEFGWVSALVESAANASG